jgi:hypothetical protein
MGAALLDLLIASFCLALNSPIETIWDQEGKYRRIFPSGEIWSDVATMPQ